MGFIKGILSIKEGSGTNIDIECEKFRIILGHDTASGKLKKYIQSPFLNCGRRAKDKLQKGLWDEERHFCIMNSESKGHIGHSQTSPI